MKIGALVFPDIDQLDLTGPFEVLSRLPETEFHIVWKTLDPVRDIHGLILTPTTTLAACPHLDVLVIPGGAGQQLLMEDREVIGFIKRYAPKSKIILSVCTGALLCGAAGLLVGKPATTHWASMDMLKFFGAKPRRNRVVISDNLITCAGVTSGIDGALVAAAKLAGEKAAKVIQLAIEYKPEPPFDCGDIRLAPRSIAVVARREFAAISAERLKTARRLGKRINRYQKGVGRKTVGARQTQY
jgi:cyclohexyl-isocyanide hydratase